MNLIAAVDQNWAIGNKNELLVRIPADQKFFRETTTGKVVVMGRKTLESFPNGLPLKNRTNIVLWPGGDAARAEADGFVMTETLDDMLAEIKKYPPDDVFVVGGAMMYRTLLPYCSHVLLTKVDADGGAETFFPDLDELPGWSLAAESEPVADNGYTIRFCTYENSEVKPL